MAVAMLAIDWGTTNRRIYALDGDGAVVAVERDDRGVRAMAREAYDAEVAAMRQRFGAVPVVAAGMVGSSRGWRDAGYVGAPAGLGELAAGLVRVDAGALIIPGVAMIEPGHCDVMRGEEVQTLGAVAAGMVPADAAVCLPGTHSKWVRLEGARIVDFETAMTGELFAVLRDHSLLDEALAGAVADGPAFRRGVRRGLDRPDLLTALFGIRAAVVLGQLSTADAPSYASGLLLGAEIGGRRFAVEGPVHLIADPPLDGLYAAALAEAGLAVAPVDPAQAFVAGICEIGRRAA